MQCHVVSTMFFIDLCSAGHLLAIYSLGEMHAEGTAVKRNCNYAVEVSTVHQCLCRCL